MVLMGNFFSKEICYDYIFDLNELEFNLGDEVIYFFEVYDNDGVNGNKFVWINLMVFFMLIVDEYEVMVEENDEVIK